MTTNPLISILTSLITIQLSIQTGPFPSGGVLRFDSSSTQKPSTLPLTVIPTVSLVPTSTTTTTVKYSSTTESDSKPRSHNIGPFQSGGLLSIQQDHPIQLSKLSGNREMNLMRPQDSMERDDLLPSDLIFAREQQPIVALKQSEGFIRLLPKDPTIFTPDRYISRSIPKLPDPEGFGGRGSRSKEEDKTRDDSREEDFNMDSWFNEGFQQFQSEEKDPNNPLQFTMDFTNMMRSLRGPDNLKEANPVSENRGSEDLRIISESRRPKPGKISIVSKKDYETTPIQVSFNEDKPKPKRVSSSAIAATQSPILPHYFPLQKILLPRHETAWEQLPRRFKTRILLLRHEEILRKKEEERLKKCNKPPDYTPCVSREEGNRRAQKCCTGNSAIKSGCNGLCHLGLKLIDVYHSTRNNHCDGAGFYHFLSCVTGAEDLRGCCKAKGVSGHCLKFCHPTAGLPNAGVHLIPCLAQFPNVMQCAWAGMKHAPSGAPSE